MSNTNVFVHEQQQCVCTWATPMCLYMSNTNVFVHEEHHCVCTWATPVCVYMSNTNVFVHEQHHYLTFIELFEHSDKLYYCIAYMFYIILCHNSAMTKYIRSCDFLIDLVFYMKLDTPVDQLCKIKRGQIVSLNYVIRLRGIQHPLYANKNHKSIEYRQSDIVFQNNSSPRVY